MLSSPSMDNEFAALQRHINIINEASDRRKVLSSIKSLADQVSTIPETEATTLLNLYLLKPLSNSLGYSSDSVRENAVILLDLLVAKSTDLNTSLPLLFTSISSRLSAPQLVEQSEEIRLKLVTLLYSIIAKAQDRAAPFINELTSTLKRTVVDSYPDVMKVWFSFNLAYK